MLIIIPALWGYSKDQVIFKYSCTIIYTMIIMIITAPDISFNYICSKFSINMHIDLS